MTITRINMVQITWPNYTDKLHVQCTGVFVSSRYQAASAPNMHQVTSRLRFKNVQLEILLFLKNNNHRIKIHHDCHTKTTRIFLVKATTCLSTKRCARLDLGNDLRELHFHIFFRPLSHLIWEFSPEAMPWTLKCEDYLRRLEQNWNPVREC